MARQLCVVCGALLSGAPAIRLNKACMWSCTHCSSWTYFPRATAEHQAALHDDEAYFEHPYFAIRREPTLVQRQRCRDVFATLAAATALTALRGEPLLDIGCDSGTFLKIAQEDLGIQPVGIDVSRRAIEVAKQHGIDAHCCAIEGAPLELTGYRVITAIDLLEHVSNPAAFLEEIRRRLRPGGIVYLETPNIRSFVFRFGRALSRLIGSREGGLIDRLFPPHHIQYFTSGSLRGLAERTGFEVVRMRARVLPRSHISASYAARAVIGLLEAGDALIGTQILLCATLRRPPEPIGAEKARGGGVYVLLPVLNEIANIGTLLDKIETALAGTPYLIGILDDGSVDGTVEYIRERMDRSDAHLHLICRKKTHRASQRGSALRVLMLWGLEHTAHDVFVEMDGDLSHRAEELQLGLSMIRSGACDVAVASKYVEGSAVINRPWGRRMVSLVCSIAVRTLISPKIRDYSNGFRFYSRDAASMAALRHYRYGSPIYLSEILALWLRGGLRVTEFPSVYVGRAEGISKLRIADLVKAAIASFEIAFRYHLTGFHLAVRKGERRSVTPAPVSGGK